VGVWVCRPDLGNNREDKIAAIGIRLKRWISLHGLAINLEPELNHFTGIVPCGIREHGVTSFAALGHLTTMADLDMALEASFRERFAVTLVRTPPPG
jgi:lipoyl(octanoyl) transferase